MSLPANPDGQTFAVLRERISSHCRDDEAATVRALLPQASLPAATLERTRVLATTLAEGVRRERARAGGVDALMLEFSLDSREGVALMCLAEALLRIPDAATRDRLIRDKIGQGDWRVHVGRSPSLFVNAAAWGLLVTGKLVDVHSDSALEQAVASLLRKGGEPLIRRGVDLAMRLLGRQFVLGRTIEEALANARERIARGYRFSFDMLGEAALNAADAQRYTAAYEQAIQAIGVAARGAGVYAGPGISIKLSALHPRYTPLQRDRVLGELLPRVEGLARLACRYELGFNIDAEEADRLDLSLDVLAHLAAVPALADWQGLGFVVQAYQKRARYVIDWLVALARQQRRRLMVRLVKGAYWDTEIKRAQVDGLADYPVFTRKAHTDVSYLACARAMLAAPDALFAQFATHNAYTIAALHALAGPADFEFQGLHGMGESIYDQIVAAPAIGRPCRIYAPVGPHEALLAYLVRRLLENGANTSFVNRVVDPAVSIADLVVDPVAQAAATAGKPHPRIPLPPALFADRRNSAGFDLADDVMVQALAQRVRDDRSTHHAEPFLAEEVGGGSAAAYPIRNPANLREIVGQVRDADAATVTRAIDCAVALGSAWSGRSADARARCLEHAADLLESARDSLVTLAVREAGKTLPNALGEVREAVDFCRYYALQARRDLAHTTARGPLVCISPWNFPLAIFVGQVSAALAAGNPVLAKPAEQTPLLATAAVHLLHRAGVPRAALQLLPGAGDVVGAALVADARIAGVLFTGSTAVSRQIAAALAGRSDEPVLVAETGGQNAMIVDSSALPEQVVTDALLSAFDSAGQRCSALRILCLQDDIAPAVLAMLRGALRELRVGDPRLPATDVGPVIDDKARNALASHVGRMHKLGAQIDALPLPAECANGCFVAPTLVELDDLTALTHEVFGPVLHVVRFRAGALPDLIDALNAKGFGLTHGIQTRIDETIDTVCDRIEAGNVYVNRNIIGAVVGVQPFGGDRLSGTGPKAGGPHYLWRLVREAIPPYRMPPDHAVALPGPTGETNRLHLRPRGRVACLGPDRRAVEAQVRAATRYGNVALVQTSHADALAAAEPGAVGQAVGDPLASDPAVVLFEGDDAATVALRRQLAARQGPLVRVVRARNGSYDPLALVRERTLTVNTTASGGNAALLSLDEATTLEGAGDHP